MGEKKLERITGILFPRRCPVCGEIILPKGNMICPPCKEKVKLVKEPKCKKCGKSLIDEEIEYCFDCIKKNHSYKMGISLFEYDDVMKQSIYGFKYKNKREYADYYIQELMKNYKRQILSWKAEALIPVPLHKSRHLYRGYNQAEVLARKIGKELELPVAVNLILRQKKTLAQKGLNHKERRKNLQDAFHIGQKVVQYKKVIVIDDIYTTGSTIEACTKVLKINGVEDVYFLSLCIGRDY